MAEKRWLLLLLCYHLYKLHDGGLQRLHWAQDVEINWLEGMAMNIHDIIITICTVHGLCCTLSFTALTVLVR